MSNYQCSPIQIPMEPEVTPWRDRAQANPYGVCPLVIITRGWAYDDEYRAGGDVDMSLFQEWLYQQVGKTIRTVPAVRIDSVKTAEQHAAANIYLDIAAQLSGEPARYDEAGELVDFCNSKRLYVLYSTGDTGLANMAGRQPFNCTPDPTNPLEPWGPGRAGGPSGWAMELVAGHEVPDSEIPTDVRPAINLVRGATLHEMLHCLGVQHPTEDEHGPEAWLSPMAGHWFFGTPECHLLPHEVAYLRDSHFLA
jgi:hypothetical protein